MTSPALGSMLYALEVPPTGGDTMFASMYAAYDALSDGLKRTLSGCARCIPAVTSSASSAPGMKGRIGNPELATQDAIHPVVITHPESGKKALYVNPRIHLAFRRLDRRRSRSRCCNTCMQHAARPEFTCRLQWRMVRWHSGTTARPGITR